MKKSLFIIMVFMVGFLSLTMTSCNKDKKATASQEDPCADQVLIARLQVQIINLQAENQRLQNELTNCLDNKVVTTPARTTTATPKTTTPARTTTATPKTTTPVATPTPTQAQAPTRTPSVGRANLDGLREGGVISFCVMANNDGGLHFPQKALDKGVTFTSIERNPTNDGSNWIVEPVEWIDGDYGLTVDGIFFVSNDLLVRVLRMDGLTLTKLQIKAPFTRWALRDMTLQDDYWIYKAI